MDVALMTIEKQTVPYCLNVVWDENGKLKGAAFYEQDVIRDDGVIISVKQGDAQPVAVLDHKGVDVAGIIGRIGKDAIALAESKDAELRAALADVQSITGERDGLQSRVAALDGEASALRAEIEALKAQKPIVRVPTAALLIVIERRGLTLQLDAIRAALPEQQQREFELYLKMPYTRRDHPLIAMVQQAFGWTDAEVDALFAEADLV
jgi:hypothetical protein